jgi:putative flippase GtrA
MINSLISHKLFKYLLVGATTIIIDYLFIYITYSVFNINYIYAVIIGFFASNLFQFFTNFFYTFNLKKDDMFILKMMVFWIAVFIGNGLALGLIVVLKSFINNLFLVKTLSLPLSFLYGYVVSNRVIYNDRFYNFLYK